MSGLARRLATFFFERAGWMRKLESSSWVQSVAERLRAREWVNAALARCPIRRTLPGSGVKYRIENFETLAVETEYFRQPAYQRIFTVARPATFIDLGCNSGIFPCLLAHTNPGISLRGLCIDANPTQVALTEKTVQSNDWKDIHVWCGLVGADASQDGQAEFFLHPTSLGSSQFPYHDSESGHAPRWKRTTAPVLEVGPAWRKIFGDETRCACLKIDVEGSEMNFLRAEEKFLEQVDAILVEWHIWATTRDEIIRFLVDHGFTLPETIEDTPRHGVLYFCRP